MKLPALKIFNITPFILTLIIVLFFACKEDKTKQASNISKINYTIDTTIVFDCFCDSLRKPDGKPLVCEPSAIVFYKDSVFMANDKPMPNSSAVFKTGLQDHFIDTENLEYINDSILIKGTKFEDFSLSPDGNFVFLTTSFSWFEPEHADHNMLFYWKTDDVRSPRLFTDTSDNRAKGSMHLHKFFANLVDTINFPNGAPYLKIEGIAAIPGDTLLFGIREYGKAYKNFNYCMKIIAMPYRLENGEIKLIKKPKLLFDYNPAEHKSCSIKEDLALSSIEYNKYDKNLYILTSYEHGEKTQDVGAYLWTISLPDLRNGKAPKLVCEAQNIPLHFSHKAEGITFIDDKTILVIHDDDRRYGSKKKEPLKDPKNQFRRKPNQAAYSVLKKQPKAINR